MTDGEEEDNIIVLSRATKNGKLRRVLEPAENTENPHNKLRGWFCFIRC